MNTLNQKLLISFIVIASTATIQGMAGKLTMVPFDYPQHHQIAQKLYDTYAVPATVTDPEARSFRLPSVLRGEQEMAEFKKIGPREASIFKVGEAIAGLTIYHTVGANKLTIDSLILEPAYEKQTIHAIEELEAMAHQRNVIAISAEPSEKNKPSFKKLGFKPAQADEDIFIKNFTNSSSSSSSSGWSKYNPFNKK